MKTAAELYCMTGEKDISHKRGILVDYLIKSENWEAKDKKLFS